LYHSPRDSRVFVPKPTPSAGITFNLARPLGMAIGLAILVIPIALVIGAIVRR